MNSTHVSLPAQRETWRDYPALRRSYLRADRDRALHEAKKPPEPEREPDPSREHASIETLTEYFRGMIARKHVGRVREEIRRYHRALDAWEAELTDGVLPICDSSRCARRGACDCPPTAEVLRQAVTTRRWHEGRARGQVERFDRVRSCGVRMMIASCKTCGDERKPVPEGCGVRRVCKKCDVVGAVQRRARFGRARGRALVLGARYGLTRQKRSGGRYTEKMLTLTIPHFTLRDASGVVRKESRCDLHARVVALWKAWPIFVRKVNRHFAQRWEWNVSYHRSFEWTPATDGRGHPHFHVYLWSPFLDVNLVRAWWAEALRAVGWPVKKDSEDRPVVRVDLRMLRGFNMSAVHELLKGGRRSALTLSKVELLDGPGLNAFDYAEGWTLADVEEFCSPDVRARLYMALEGRRLTQASAGFFADDEPAICLCCGSSNFQVRFESIEDETGAGGPCPSDPRGPPS